MRNFGNAIETFYGSLTISALNGKNGLQINAASNNYAAAFNGPSISNQSYGVIIAAGTTINDVALRVANASGINEFIVAGDGSVEVGNIAGKGYGTLNAQNGIYVNGGSVLAASASGTYAIPAPSAGNTGLNVTGAAGAYAELIQAGLTTGSSYGLYIAGGTNTADRALHVSNSNSTVTLLDLDGVGNLYITDGTSSTQFRVGYLGMPQSTNQTPNVSDRGKSIQGTGTISISNGVFSGGDSFIVYNQTGANITIGGSIGTMRLAGTTTTGGRTLAPFGIATLYFQSSTVVVVGGNVT